MFFMFWVILFGIIGIVLNIIYIIYSKSPYKYYILFKVLCITYAVVAYAFYATDKYWFDISWVTFENFRVVCIRPLVVMLLTWFILDAYLRRWGRWRDM